MWKRVMLVASVTLLGCGITFQNDDQVDGIYTLRSIEGRALPALLSTGPEQLTITSGVLTLEGDGDWSEVLSYTMVENGQVVPKRLDDGGRWTLRSRAVSLLGVGGSVLDGSFSSFSGPKLDLVRYLAGRQVPVVYAR
jgi:hypothetical protein